jgi:CheY-like chemotaxis protein
MTLSHKKDANILVVDDNKVLADNLVEYLTKLGFGLKPLMVEGKV